MRSKRNRRMKIKRKKKRKVFLSIILVSILLSSIFIYGDDVFYAIKTYLYRNQALKIDIRIDKNDDLQNINLGFLNKGSCDVYLRGFVFVYEKGENKKGTIISNDTVKINYGNKELWYEGEDNYIYYTKPLKVGDSTEKPMVESIDIQLSDEDKRLLENNHLAVDVVMEAVQVNNFAYKYQWDMVNTDLQDLFNGKSSNTLESKDVIRIIFN